MKRWMTVAVLGLACLSALPAFADEAAKPLVASCVCGNSLDYWGKPYGLTITLLIPAYTGYGKFNGYNTEKNFIKMDSQASCFKNIEINPNCPHVATISPITGTDSQ